MTRQCQPGDQVILTGIFLPMMKTGFGEREAAGLVCETFLDAHVNIL